MSKKMQHSFARPYRPYQQHSLRCLQSNNCYGFNIQLSKSTDSENDLGQIICVDDNEVFDHDFYNSDFIEEVALKVKDMLKSYDPKTFITPPDYDRHIKRKFIEIYEEAAEMMGIEF